MLLISYTLIGSLLLILFHSGETIICPSNYYPIAVGCYKILNGLNMSWFDAQQYCFNDSLTLSNNVTGAITHLVALEYVTEKTALFYYMQAYNFRQQFWIDGMVQTSTWNWSNQSITWYFTADEQAIIGNGSNYKLAYISNSSTNVTYQIADDVNNKKLNFICEYQVPCNQNNSCLNNAKCYLNIGQELCVCAAGYTGQICDSEIMLCLSSPCLHDGECIDSINNYTCDCSNTFYTGSNCEIPLSDSTQSERSAAFWSVLGIVTGLIVLLTLSDLPWEDILTAIGCSCDCLKCCNKKTAVENIIENDLHLSNSPTNNYNSEAKNMSTPIHNGISTSKGMNYHVMNTVWDPEHIRNQTLRNPQYNGYRSPIQSTTTPNNTLIQSFAVGVIAKQKEKELEDKRIYAVNINESRPKTKDPVDTMINWTQQLQEELRNNKKIRETSASSTKQLIHSSNKNDY